MRITDVFIDLDNTILDFYAAEEAVLGRALAACGIAPTPETLALYARINVAQWQLLEEGKVHIEEIGERRFALLCEALGVQVEARHLAQTYETMLGATSYFMPGAQAMLDALRPHYRLYLVTNGMANVQYARIETAGLASYFDALFISSDLGAVKPQQAFFDACFAQIDDFAKERCVILGDGLNSDIKGGIQAGIATIWYHPQGVVNQSPWQPDAEVSDLAQVPQLLAHWGEERDGRYT